MVSKETECVASCCSNVVEVESVGLFPTLGIGGVEAMGLFLGAVGGAKRWAHFRLLGRRSVLGGAWALPPRV